MSDLYNTDLLTWSEQQAPLLRRLSRGERVNDQIDCANVAEEIESVGSKRAAVMACGRDVEYVARYGYDMQGHGAR